jgi:hypothetical protein
MNYEIVTLIFYYNQIINVEDNMSIYYGSKEVKIIQDLEGEDVKVQYGDRIMDVPVIELEADGGIYEIHDAIKELKKQK